MIVLNNFFGGPFFGGGFFGPGQVLSGGSPGYTGYETRTQTREDIRRSRERFGIKVSRVIADVAKQQAQRLETDKQKQYEELTRELELRGLEFHADYLEALARQREKLLDAEIRSRIIARLKLEQQERDVLMLMVVAAAAS